MLYDFGGACPSSRTPKLPSKHETILSEKKRAAMANVDSTNNQHLKTEALELLRAIITRELSRPPYNRASISLELHCPRCKSNAVVKRGLDSTGKQRYQCGACNRSFTATTGNELGSTNIPLETWLSFAQCHIDKKTLRDSALTCNVSLKTAFYMRKRLNSIIGKYSAVVKRRLRGS